MLASQGSQSPKVFLTFITNFIIRFPSFNFRTEISLSSLALYNFADVQVRREEVREHLTKEDLEKRAAVYLTETETLWILDMPTVMVSVESEEAEKVQYVFLQLYTCFSISG